MKRKDVPTGDHPFSPIARVVTLRRLEAFGQVYRDRILADAAYHLNLSTRGLDRMIRELEAAFGGPLFERKKDGCLSPTAFGERFHNDMIDLTEACQRLEQRIDAIRRSGRAFRIGSSPVVFKTPVFGRIFRELRATSDVRISYVPVAGLDAVTALTAGRCDWYVGCREPLGSRFASEKIAEVRLRVYRRAGGCSESMPESVRYVVAFDGKPPKPPGTCGSWLPIPEERWLRWLDHPEECEPGCVIRAPEVSVDPAYWSQTGLGSQSDDRQALTCFYIRKHPYEFIPALLSRVRSRLLSQ